MCKIDHNYLPIELFGDLNVIQLKEYIAPKNNNALNELSQYSEKNSLTKQSNKDNVDNTDNADNAIIGKINLIKLVCDSRNKYKILRMKPFKELFLSKSSLTNS